MKLKLAPHIFYLTQLINTEKPFWGKLWDVRDLGHYECAVCTQRLFMGEHKFLNKSGYPTFWSHIVNSIDY